MGLLNEKIVLITGAARGQGRSHAERCADEGADVIAIDRCADMDTPPYALATPADLEETAEAVRSRGRRVVTLKADVRDFEALSEAVREGEEQIGPIDVLSANAGIFSAAPTWELTSEQWSEMIAVNLTGVWHTVKAVVPGMLERGSGSIVLTGSTGALRGYAHTAHYVAAKHGVVGLMKTLSNELAPHSIRVNCVNPTSCNTPMIQNEAMYKLWRPDLENPQEEDVLPAFDGVHPFPVPWVEPSDVSNALVWLASDQARVITGHQLNVDAGMLQKV